MKEFEVYIPMTYNNGQAVAPEKLSALKRSLVDQFGGLTQFPQENEGLWKVGRFTFRDKITILRVLADDRNAAEHFFKGLKEKLKQDWQQDDVLIVVRDVITL